MFILSIKRAFLVLCACLYAQAIWAQNRFQTGVLPSINFNKNVDELYSLNLKIETREQFWSGLSESDPPFNHQHLLTDLTFIGSRKIGLTEKINFGYLLRLREQGVVHRTIQQFTFISRLKSLNLGHRFVTDQTFESEEKTVYRLRYRLSTELPLQGEKADPGELYLKLNNELIQSWQNGSQPLTEYRFGPFLGYFIDKTHKLEVGLDYRNQSLLINPTRHSYWLSINWFVRL